MIRSKHPLFAPYELGGIRLPNRFVMAPMTRNRADANGVPTPLMGEYYAQRAGAGLIIAEAATPALDGQTYPNIAGIYNDAQRKGWRDVVNLLTEAGGRAFLQLQHGGRIGHPDTNGKVPMAPSAAALPDLIHTTGGKKPAVLPREMTTKDIDGTIANFVSASRRAVEAGFLGVEVHAANGYLLHQFLAPNTNQRSDQYGGTPRRRAAFVLGLVDAVTTEIGPERVGVRISPGNRTNGIIETDQDLMELYPRLAEELSDRNLAYLHIGFANQDKPIWAALRSAWKGTLIGNPANPVRFPADGGFEAAQRLLNEGADLVSIGRPFLANPDLLDRFSRSLPMNRPRPDQFMYVGGADGYTDYPVFGSRDL